YTLHEVQDGAWTIAVSRPEDGHPSWSSPHPTTYYPGTPNANAAKFVIMKRAGLVQNIDFVVPKPLTVVKVKGTVLNADGTPPTKASVGVDSKSRNRSAVLLVDDTGAFSFDEIEGYEVTLHACKPDDWRACTRMTVK